MSANLQKPKPGLALALLLPFAIWMIASIVAIVFFVMGFQRAEEVADDFARVPAAQDQVVNLTESGDYRIWIDTSSSSDRFSPGAVATITGPDDQVINANTYIGSLDFNDLEAVLTFEAPEAGEYTFNIEETGFEPDPTGVEFAIGKDNPLGEIGTGAIFMGIIGTVGFVVALVLMIILLVKRGRSKRKIVQSGLQGGGYGGGYQQPGGYPPPGGYQQPGGYPPPGGSPPPGSSW